MGTEAISEYTFMEVEKYYHKACGGLLSTQATENSQEEDKFQWLEN